MTAETVVSQGLRTASASLADVPHRRRDASYPEALGIDPKHDVFLNQDTSVLQNVLVAAKRGSHGIAEVRRHVQIPAVNMAVAPTVIWASVVLRIFPRGSVFPDAVH